MILGTQVASLFALTNITFSQPTENQNLQNGSSLIQGALGGMQSISAFIEMDEQTKYRKKICQKTFRRRLIPFRPKQSTYRHCQKKPHC
jgi:hypothetical protein